MKPMLPLSAAGLALAATVAFAQPPQGSPVQPPAKQRAPLPPSGGRNLQVLPPNILQRNLINTMQAFNSALGVQCSHCHVPGDFASDANPRKNIARGMLRMTRRLNSEILPSIQGLTRPTVSCSTCHRGQPIPSTALPSPTPSPAPPRG